MRGHCATDLLNHDTSPALLSDAAPVSVSGTMVREPLPAVQRVAAALQFAQTTFVQTIATLGTAPLTGVPPGIWPMSTAGEGARESDLSG